jgi:hypothetical protein
MRDLAQGVREIGVISTVNGCFLEGAHKTRSNAIVQRFALIGQANANLSLLKHVGGQPSRLLAALVGVKDERRGCAERHAQGSEGQFLAQRAAQSPAADGTGISSEDHGQLHETDTQPDIGDIGHPDLVGLLER